MCLRFSPDFRPDFPVREPAVEVLSLTQVRQNFFYGAYFRQKLALSVFQIFDFIESRFSPGQCSGPQMKIMLAATPSPMICLPACISNACKNPTADPTRPTPICTWWKTCAPVQHTGARTPADLPVPEPQGNAAATENCNRKMSSDHSPG